MTNRLILNTIQLLLISLITWIMGTILLHARQHQINLKEKFLTGFLIGYVDRSLGYFGNWYFCDDDNTFKATKLVEDDRKIPATMSTAHVVPVLVEELCFVTIVKVDITTLVCMAAASFYGSLCWNTDNQKLEYSTGSTCFWEFCSLLQLWSYGLPHADQSWSRHFSQIRGLKGIWLLVGIIFDFIIGMLMTMGLGNYARIDFLFFDGHQSFHCFARYDVGCSHDFNSQFNSIY